MTNLVPVLEIGGTHVTAAAVDPSDWRGGGTPPRAGAPSDGRVEGSPRYSLDADAAADALIQRFFRAGNALRAPAGATWGIAMPDPFDYARGIGLFEGVGKFTALRGVDVGDALRSRLRGEFAFVNDADAFLLGEWAASAAVGAGRC